MAGRARELVVEAEALRFVKQRPEPGGTPPRGTRLAPSTIRAVRCQQSQPELVLDSGEILAVTPRHRSALDLFARVHGISRWPENRPEIDVTERLRGRWRAVEELLGATPGETAPLCDELLDRYAEPQRSYHDRRHLDAVVGAVEESTLEGEQRAAALLAAWFHDAVYQPGTADNEERSAALLRQRLGPLCQERALVDTAAELIRGTATPLAAEGPAAEILADADLAILGEEASVYRRYADAIRAEYAGIGDYAFRLGRLAFLRQMQTAQRERRLFHDLHPLHEALAAANLADELAALEAGRPD